MGKNDDPDLPPSSEAWGYREPTGKTVMRQNVALVKSAPEEAGEYLRPALAEYCEKIIEGCRRMDRTCLNIYAQAMKLIGAQTELTFNFWQRIGAKDEGHGRALMGAALDVEVMDDAATYRECLRYVSEYRRERGLLPLLEPAGRQPLPAGSVSGSDMGSVSRADVIDDPGAS